MHNFMGPNGFVWFIGRVEAIDDNFQNGRMKVRCFGYHTDDKNELPSQALPWAIHIKPVTGGSFYSPTGCVENTIVFGFFADGVQAQYPIVLGVINATTVRPGADRNATQTQILANRAGGTSVVAGVPSLNADQPGGQSISESNTVQFLGSLTESQYQQLKNAIAKRESNNNYGAVNGLGYIGKYQFGNPALYDTGFTVSPDRSNTILNNEANWKGKVGATSIQSFLSNIGNCQEIAMDDLLRQNFQQLRKNNIVSSITPPRELAGYLAVAHLLGAGGSTRFARGDKSGRDGNGVSGQQYYNLGFNSITL